MQFLYSTCSTCAAFSRVRKNAPNVCVGARVRSGHREVFLLSRDEFEALPLAEKSFFRPAVENRNIDAGRIVTPDYLFYPYTTGLPPILDEATLERVVRVSIPRG